MVEKNKKLPSHSDRTEKWKTSKEEWIDIILRISCLPISDRAIFAEQALSKAYVECAPKEIVDDLNEILCQIKFMRLKQITKEEINKPFLGKWNPSISTTEEWKTPKEEWDKIIDSIINSPTLAKGYNSTVEAWNKAQFENAPVEILDKLRNIFKNVFGIIML